MLTPDEAFLTHLRDSLDDGSFVSLTLSAPRGGEPGLVRSMARRVALKRGPHLSFTHRFSTRDVTENVPTAGAVAFVAEALRTRFGAAHLFTTACDVELRASAGVPGKVWKRPPSRVSTPSAAHDRPKQRVLGEGAAAYLHPLGITEQSGRVRAGLEHKHRQIHRYVELVEPLLRRAGLLEKEVVSIVDVGAGKGYLTFALYDRLTRGLGLRAQVLGVELRPELVALGNEVAAAAGFEGLRFRAGTVLDAELGEPDVLIALHACDTATDEALFRGICAKARVIVCAPCCHKELRPQLDVRDLGLEGVLRHGLLRERQAEWLTDGVRALLLEGRGYKTDVFEFVAAEHTQKNVMIAAVQGGISGAAEARARLDALRALFGWKQQRLETLLASLAG